jgi:hypothetical protein
MSQSILIVGESGVGKSTSIRTLPPEETMIISVIGKSLPFRGAKSKYTKLSPDGMTGNFYVTDDSTNIMRVIKLVNEKRQDIKYLVIDDFGYTMTNSFMRRALEVGYKKFSEIGFDAFKVFDVVSNLRDDLFCFVMMHTEIDQNGRYKPKSIGKMVDQYVCIEGKFSCVFHAFVSEGKYRFITNNDGQHMARTPLDMFSELYIDNDLKLICDTITNYEE